jgi:RimJ/RimL family protein N-acetyltransferase
MIKITKIQDRTSDVIKQVLTADKLFKLIGGVDKDKYQTPLNFEYLQITLNNELAGLFVLRELGEILIEGHICLLPEYWGKSVSDSILSAGIEFLKQNTKYHQIITTVPTPCLHVMKFLTRNNFRMCGTYHNATIFNNELTDLILFEISI